MVRTRQKGAQKHVQDYSRSTHTLSSDSHSGEESDDWDIPGMNGTRLKATVIRTYSKIRPRRTILTSVTKDDFGSIADTQSNVLKSGQKTPVKRKNEISHTPQPPAVKRPRMVPRSTTRKPNKTTVSPGSMVVGTMMVDGSSDIVNTIPMSLCSLANEMEANPIDSKTVHNSTLDMAKNCSSIQPFADYIPNEISLIQGDGDPKLYSSMIYNKESTPPKQTTGADITKRVQFSVGKANLRPKCPVQSAHKTDKRRSILKMPRETNNTSCQQNNGLSHSKRVKSPEEVKPVIISQNNGEVINYRDITPEIHDSNKVSTSSAVGSSGRRLLYPPHENDPPIPICMLFDLPQTKPRKPKVLCGKVYPVLSADEIHTLKTDILQ